MSLIDEINRTLEENVRKLEKLSYECRQPDNSVYVSYNTWNGEIHTEGRDPVCVTRLKVEKDGNGYLTPNAIGCRRAAQSILGISRFDDGMLDFGKSLSDRVFIESVEMYNRQIERSG
ncbi:hypothetical protein KY363_00015 [Candidatus Woesearchaeota archaeon]|nr:hypothetical protein [Candidatus Woesearchaeota archaeon]